MRIRYMYICWVYICIHISPAVLKRHFVFGGVPFVELEIRELSHLSLGLVVFVMTFACKLLGRPAF